MDWGTLTASLIGTGAIVSAVGYLLKAATDRALDLRLDKLRQENQAQIQEQFRRQAFLWERQFDAAKGLLTLIYRFRNTSRELLILIEEPGEEAQKQTGDILRRLKAYSEAISEILYEERAVLPRELFSAAHELKTPVLRLHMLTDRYLSRRSSIQSTEHQERLQSDLKEMSRQIDSIYTMVTDIVHRTLGVEQGTPANLLTPVRESSNRYAIGDE